MAEGFNPVEEFKKAKPPEKVVIVLGVVAVAGLALYLIMRSSRGGATSANDSASGSTGQTAGFPSAGGVPVLPSGTSPIYDPNGNLVAFQNPVSGTSTSTSVPGTTEPTHPANWFESILGKIGYNATINPGGWDVNGQRFWVGKGNSNLFYAPIGSTVIKGQEGRIWLKLPDGTQQLLTGPGLQASAKK